MAVLLVPWMKGIDLGAGALLSSAVFLALGVLFIATSRPRTVVHLVGEKWITLRAPVVLTVAELLVLRERLRDELGYEVVS